MRAHEEKTAQQKARLENDIQDLSYFMHTDSYAALPAVDQGLLMVQIRAMYAHSRALGERIERF